MSGPLVRRIRLLAGLVMFVAIIGWAWTAVGGIELRWTYVALLAALGAPLMVVTMVVEQHTSTYLADVSVSWSSSFRTSVLATASNYLPIPGALLVRVGALKLAGSELGRATAAAALLGVTWLLLTLVVGGPALMSSDFALLAWLMILVGLLGSLGAVIFYVRRFSLDFGIASVSIVVIIWKVGLHAANTYLGLAAVGADTTLANAALISAAAVIASAVGLFPGGLGLRELVASILAGAVGLDPALGALASVVTRTIMTGWIGIAAAMAVGLNRGPEMVDRRTITKDTRDPG